MLVPSADDVQLVELFGKCVSYMIHRLSEDEDDTLLAPDISHLAMPAAASARWQHSARGLDSARRQRHRSVESESTLRHNENQLRLIMSTYTATLTSKTRHIPLDIQPQRRI